mgnify:CR=1 FL=1
MDLCNINDIKALLARHGFHFSKAKGQNFLTQSWVPQNIVLESGVDETCGVLEVGPGIGPLTQKKVPGDAFVPAVGTQGVDSGQIHCQMGGAPDGTGFLLHGDAGEIAHMLVCAGEGVEKGSFPAVWVTGQSEDHGRTSLRRVMFRASSRRRVRL